MIEKVTPGKQQQVVVHAPDTALMFNGELIIDRTGARWRVTAEPRFDSVNRVYLLRTDLQSRSRVISGCFRVAEDIVLGLERDGGLRVFVAREIQAYLDRTNMQNGFAFDLPYRC